MAEVPGINDDFHMAVGSRNLPQNGYRRIVRVVVDEDVLIAVFRQFLHYSPHPQIELTYVELLVVTGRYDADQSFAHERRSPPKGRCRQGLLQASIKLSLIHI